MSFIEDLLRYDFLQRAFLSAVLASIASGIVGSYVTTKRMTYVAGSISHSMLAGMGGAVFLSHKTGWIFLSPLLGALVIAIIAAVGIYFFSRNIRERLDTTLSALWAIGMAAGLLFIQMTPGYRNELVGYLFGNILLITPLDLYCTALLDGLLLALFFLFYNEIFSVTFDEEFALLRGGRVKLIQITSLILTAITLVLLLRLAGIVMVIALLTLPPASASRFATSLKGTVLLAILISLFATTGGLVLSYFSNTPPGATISLFVGGLYLTSILLSRQKNVP